MVRITDQPIALSLNMYHCISMSRNKLDKHDKQFTYFVPPLGMEGCCGADIFLHVHRWWRIDHSVQLQQVSQQYSQVSHLTAT